MNGIEEFFSALPIIRLFLNTENITALLVSLIVNLFREFFIYLWFVPHTMVFSSCQIFSNGKYKSVVHRSVVNNNATRISLAIANGPSLDTVVSPASELVENHPPAYIGLKYKEYLELQQSRNLNGKCMLDRVRRL